MDIGGVHILTRGVPHQGFADFLQDAGFHHSAVEGVPEVVEAVVTNPGAADGRHPGRLDLADGLAFEGKNPSFRFLLCPKELEEAPGEGDLAGFAFRRFRVSDEEKLAVEVDVLPALRENFTAPHARIERGHDDGAEMRSGRLEK